MRCKWCGRGAQCIQSGVLTVSKQWPEQALVARFIKQALPGKSNMWDGSINTELKPGWYHVHLTCSQRTCTKMKGLKEHIHQPTLCAHFFSFSLCFFSNLSSACTMRRRLL